MDTFCEQASHVVVLGREREEKRSLKRMTGNWGLRLHWPSTPHLESTFRDRGGVRVLERLGWAGQAKGQHLSSGQDQMWMWMRPLLKSRS